MNRVYIDKGILPYLNNSHLDMYLIECLNLFNSINGMGLSFFSFYSNILFKLPHFQAMLKLNIFYHQFYLPYLDYTNLPVYLSTYRDYSK